MDSFLPVWAQPHHFVLLDQRQRGVFTFGLALAEITALASTAGVRWFGRRYGFEWLAGLSQGVQREQGRKLPPSELERFVLEKHGIVGPRVLSSEYAELWTGEEGEPPDDILGYFAQEHGGHIRSWAANAFNLVDASLLNWARARERVPRGYEAAAERRLALTQMAHRLRPVNAIDGSHHWARRYESLYERVALELEDVAVRRPKLRICPLCSRVYVPLRRGQRICGNQIWDAQSRKLVRRCTPASETLTYGAAEAALYARQRKTRWAAMNRIRTKYAYDDPRTQEALAEWEAWRAANPPPRKPGRPAHTSSDDGKPPFLPASD